MGQSLAAAFQYEESDEATQARLFEVQTILGALSYNARSFSRRKWINFNRKCETISRLGSARQEVLVSPTFWPAS